MTIDDPRIGVKPDRCPGCDGYLNASSDMDGNLRPKPDDRSVCIHCGCFMKYSAELRLVLLTPAEVADTIEHLNPEERKVLAALAMARASKGGVRS